jgi:hypothetical protein
MTAGLKFKRPVLKMNIGQVLPPAELPRGTPKKVNFQDHAAQVMKAVYSLVPAGDSPSKEEIRDEWFEMELIITDKTVNMLDLPSSLKQQNAALLVKLLHCPAILEIFVFNLELPTKPLQQLSKTPPLPELIVALESILYYLKEDNPYLLTYRFGIPEGLGIQDGLNELLGVLEWCSTNGLQISITPVRHYYSLSQAREIIQREQELTNPGCRSPGNEIPRYLYGPADRQKVFDTGHMIKLTSFHR